MPKRHFLDVSVVLAAIFNKKKTVFDVKFIAISYDISFKTQNLKQSRNTVARID